jgi:glycosyltransferase involved in cell wall biosynthesis
MRQEAPLVSVVTPFYNSAEYLAQCIQSVLRQSYQEWEYILLDNCSADASYAIAEEYARRDSRIRLVRESTFVGQLENYNRTLRLISPRSKYCKFVQADDWIFPRCLEEMVALAESHSSLGVVSSYSIYYDHVGHEIPLSLGSVLPGKQAARVLFMADKGFLGSPTCLMFSSDEVRGRDPFFGTTSPCEDLRVCLEIFRTRDFGFVHQVLSYNRRDNDSILTRVIDYEPYLLVRLLLLYEFGPVFLTAEESQRRVEALERQTYEFLAHGIVRGMGRPLLDFYRRGLASVGRTLDQRKLALCMAMRLLSAAANPGASIESLLRRLKRVP